MGNCQSPLRAAIRSGNPQAVKDVLEEAGEASPDLINDDSTSDCLFSPCLRNNNSPLHSAIIQNRWAIVKILLDYGADPNQTGESA